MDISEIRRENLRRLMNEMFDGKQAKIADALEKSPNYISRCLSLTMAAEHRKKIGEDFAREIEAKLGLPRYSLDSPLQTLGTSDQSAVQGSPGKANAHLIGPILAWDDDTPLDDDEVEIPLLKDVRVSGGPGVVAEDLDSGRCVRMGKSSLRERGVQFSNAICVTVSGNSMEPALPDGSTVGVNMHITTIKDGKVYVIKHDGELRVKQVYRLPGGGIRLRSFNRAEHADEDYTPTEMAEKDISILGKVFWSSAFWD